MIFSGKHLQKKVAQRFGVFVLIGLGVVFIVSGGFGSGFCFFFFP